MERIYTSLRRSKQFIAALTDDFLSEETTVQFKGFVDGLEGDRGLGPGLEVDLLPPNTKGGNGREGLSGLLGSGVESDPVKCGYARKRKGGGLERGGSKHLRVKISDTVYLDRLLR